MQIVNLTARLNLKISKDLHAMIKRAAEIQGCTVTDFVVAAVQEAALAALEEADITRLSIADQSSFTHALMSPPRPNAALTRAFNRRHSLIATG